jgi:hypothetical protein
MYDMMHTYIYIDIYTYNHISRLSYAQRYLHTWTPAHARAHTASHTRARIGGAATHNGPRRIDDPAERVRPRPIAHAHAHRRTRGRICGAVIYVAMRMDVCVMYIEPV